MSVCVSFNGVFAIVLFKTLYAVLSVLSENIKRVKKSGISSSSTDTTRSFRDPYIVPFNFIFNIDMPKKGIVNEVSITFS